MINVIIVIQCICRFLFTYLFTQFVYSLFEFLENFILYENGLIVGSNLKKSDSIEQFIKCENLVEWYKVIGYSPLPQFVVIVVGKIIEKYILLLICIAEFSLGKDSKQYPIVFVLFFLFTNALSHSLCYCKMFFRLIQSINFQVVHP